MTESKARILVADDHAVVRAGLKTILSTREGWEICAEAETGDEAVALARRYRPDVAVLDLNMPGIKTGALGFVLKSDADRDLLPPLKLFGAANPT
jgi:DNA-binding NarL/FixJ family response regulator